MMLDPQPSHAVVGAPRLSWRHLSRPRLLARLDHTVPLTVVRAPAGRGKTALLAEWAQTLPAPGVWLRLDDDITERLAFWQAVVTAMDDAGFLPPDSPLEHGPLPQDGRLLRALRRGFDQLPRKHVLVLDGADGLDPRIHEDILTLVQYTETLSVVVAGRARSGLEDPRVAIRVDQSIIRADDLLLSVEEIAALVDRKIGDGAPAAWAEEPDLPYVVREVTGGDATFVRSLLRSARASSTTDLDGIRTLGAAVVRAELRRVLDDPSHRALTNLLLRCSIPDSLPPGLVQALAGGSDEVDEGLRRLETMGLLDLTGPSREVSVRAPVREHLRAEATARLAEETAVLHARTAHWELTHGTPLGALRHAVAARDYDLVTAVIAHHWTRFLWDGILLEAEQILETIPRGDLRHQPIIAGLLGLAANMNPARRGRAVGLLALSVAGVRQRRRRASRPERLLLDVLESSFLRIAGEPSGILFRARSAARMLDEWSSELSPRPTEPVFRTQLAISFFRAGRLTEALDVLAEALSAPVDASALALHQALSIKAGILAHLGSMTASRALLEQVRELPWPEGLRDTYLGAFYHYAAAWDRLERLDLDGAERHLEVLDPQSVNIELRPYLTMLRAYVAALRGDAATELVRVRAHRARDDAERRLLLPERVLVGRVEAMLTLGSGHTGAARRLIAALPRSAVNDAYAALIELAAGRPDAALSCIAASQGATNLPPRVHAVQYLVLAVSSLRQQDRRTALSAAQRLVAQMRYHGLRVLLAILPRADLLALGELLRDERPDLLDALGDLEEIPDVVTDHRDIVPLSEREQVVLTELSTGASTATIAERLGVSVNTVKSQLRSSYRKLGVSSREEALAIAVSEGLLARE